LIESGGERLLVDCGPDLRQQLLGARVNRLHGVIVTHAHGDHCHGIDDLRPVAQAMSAPVPMYGRSDVLEALKRRFAYAFAKSSFYQPIAAAHELGGTLQLGNLRMRFVDQPHGSLSSLGLRAEEGTFALGYATDFNELTGEMANLYEGVDLWIADCLTRRAHPTHMHLDGVLSAAREMRVGQVLLVHMGNSMDYRTLASELPDWAAPAYDGLEFSSP
jgi:phosphoribosyl 1,2-cyclic phosphate phosphodiesterase